VSRGWRSPPLAFAAALLLALLVTGGQGYLYQARRSTGRPAVARVGQTVAVGGAQVVVRSIQEAAELPAQDAGSPPVHGPPGSLLVLVTWEQTVVDPAVDLGARYCDTALVADDGTTWDEESDAVTGVRRPAALTCSGSDDRPLVRGEPQEVGQLYLIPAAYGPRVRWRLSVVDHGPAVEFAR